MGRDFPETVRFRLPGVLRAALPGPALEPYSPHILTATFRKPPTLAGPPFTPYSDGEFCRNPPQISSTSIWYSIPGILRYVKNLPFFRFSRWPRATEVLTRFSIYNGKEIRLRQFVMRSCFFRHFFCI